MQKYCGCVSCSHGDLTESVTDMDWQTFLHYVHIVHMAEQLTLNHNPYVMLQLDLLYIFHAVRFGRMRSPIHPEKSISA